MEALRNLRPGMLARALWWLVAMTVCGIALVFLYRDGDQQDAGYHYLFARWAWEEPSYLVNVWARPLFTLIYSIPAQFSYRAAKLTTVAICVATAWQTWRLALDLRLERPELAIPLLCLQPAFFLIFPVTLTEPLFAFIFVTALRLHQASRIYRGMLVASLLILVRPEGFFLGVLWGIWVLFDRREGRDWWQRLVGTLLLASGALFWWGSAWLITGDPLWIMHNWPHDWGMASAANGRGPLWWYVALLPLIVGPLALPPFLAGMRRMLLRRHFLTGISAFIFIFVTHSVMYWQGWFGAAGFARYLVCVSPAIALITLAGWDEIGWLRWETNTAVALALSAAICIFYIDGYRFTRDARAIDDMLAWFQANERPVSRLIFSQSYMCIRLDRGPRERLDLTNNRQRNLDFVRNQPPGTLVFWDSEVGPKWYGLNAGDFQALGYVPLRTQSYHLDGWVFKIPWRWHGGPRRQELSLLYKEETNTKPPEITGQTE
jgi:hypothetical protein